MNKYEHIQIAAFNANMQLPEFGLVLFTFGNVSAADRNLGVFAIKPSGVPYTQLTPEKMIVLDFDGNKISGSLRPSSDTPTHAVLYKNWEHINGISHTHSTYATAWAQAGKDIPIYGTTHADHSHTDIPCAPVMNDKNILGDYEFQTGMQILDCFNKRNLNYREVEMILLEKHAPFTWGATAEKAVYNSAVLEEIAKLALLTQQVYAQTSKLKHSLIQKHFNRKHGPGSYYGQ